MTSSAAPCRDGKITWLNYAGVRHPQIRIVLYAIAVLPAAIALPLPYSKPEQQGKASIIIVELTKRE
jgi:hypothetical protein